mmetsp:Transcript_18947/g.73001  ORF Transcript_18947/g.73001 Transcript_18947/m.73001 type:complete len:233 (-) Transcript_18947:116-814(-)
MSPVWYWMASGSMGRGNHGPKDWCTTTRRRMFFWICFLASASASCTPSVLQIHARPRTRIAYAMPSGGTCTSCSVKSCMSARWHFSSMGLPTSGCGAPGVDVHRSRGFWKAPRIAAMSFLRPQPQRCRASWAKRQRKSSTEATSASQPRSMRKDLLKRSLSSGLCSKLAFIDIEQLVPTSASIMSSSVPLLKPRLMPSQSNARHGFFPFAQSPRMAFDHRSNASFSAGVDWL